MIRVIHGDCLEVMKTLEAESIHAVVTDPPYGLRFMGRTWDHGVPGIPFWQEALRVLKPGGYLLAMGGTRTYHRLICAIEDAGFEIRDSLQYLYDNDPLMQEFMESLSAAQREFLEKAWPSDGLALWTHGQGFPKSLDISKALDEAAGAERAVVGYRSPFPPDHPRPNKDFLKMAAARDKGVQASAAYGDRASGLSSSGVLVTAPATDLGKQWAGWGTALKPAFEPVIVARKPLVGTVAQNVTRYGVGGLNINGCRVPVKAVDAKAMERCNSPGSGQFASNGNGGLQGTGTFARSNSSSPVDTSQGRWPANLLHDGSEAVVSGFPLSNDVGSAARFFYAAKVSKKERQGTKHPTTKPLALMEWLVKLVTPPRGVVLDPFLGSGTTLVAAKKLGFDAIGIELEAEYVQWAKRRLGLHDWREDSADAAGWRCAVCGAGDQDAAAQQECGRV